MDIFDEHAEHGKEDCEAGINAADVEECEAGLDAHGEQFEASINEVDAEESEADKNKAPFITDSVRTVRNSCFILYKCPRLTSNVTRGPRHIWQLKL